MYKSYMNSHCCAGGLFHWRHDGSDQRKYSLAPEDYPRLPLFRYDPKDPDVGVAMLNEVFYVVFQDMGSWPCMQRLDFNTLTDVRNLAGSDWPAFAESDSGGAQEAVPVLSKPLVAYVEGLLASTPYRQATDVRAAGLADAQFRTYNELFNTMENAKWKDYLTRKLSEWFQDCPRDPASDLLRDSRRQAEVAGADADEQPEAVTVVCKVFDD